MRYFTQPRPALAIAGIASVTMGIVAVSLARVQPAQAQSPSPAPPPPPAVVHMLDVLNGPLTENPVTHNLVKNVYVGDAGTITAIQVGDLPRHTHETASEMFYVVEGTAVVTVGDATQAVKPGDLMIVPKGALHSIKADSGRIKAVLITMPSRAADDVHFVK